MIRIFKLVLLLVVSQVAFGQAPSNYTNINGRYRWIAGMFDSTFHIPKGTSPSLRTGGSTNAGGLFYNTSDSSVYTYTGTQWIKVRGSINPSDTTNKYVTQVYKKNGSDSVFYVKGGIHTWAFNDSTGSPGGGGGGKVYYFNGGVNMGTFGGLTMYELGDTANTGAAANFTRATTGAIANFITDPNKPGLLQIPAGSWTIDAWLSETGGGANHAEIWIEVEKWDGSTITTIATSPIEQITEGSTPNLYSWSVSIPTTSLTVTDRIIIQFYISNTNGKTVTLYTQNGYVGEVHTTFTTGIGAINGLTAAAQYLVTGTSGTDFNISSVTATHTFNLPTASASNRGALSSTDWTTFNSKIGGSGTTNYVSKFTGSGTIGNSQIFDNATSVGIGTAFPSASYKLDVNGNINVSNAVNYSQGGTKYGWTYATAGAMAMEGLQGADISLGTGSGAVATERMVIKNSGNVGIGITPDSMFTVAQGTHLQRGVRMSGLPSAVGTKTLRIDASGTVSVADTGSFVPTSRTLTINGTTQDLTADRTWNVGTVTTAAATGGGQVAFFNGSTVLTSISTLYFDGVNKLAIGNSSPDSMLSVTQGAHIQRGVRLSGLPTAPGTRALRVDANGTLSVSDTLANGISGSGTTNYIPKFTSSSAIGNSLVYDNGTNVGIGTTSPLRKFSVIGIINSQVSDANDIQGLLYAQSGEVGLYSTYGSTGSYVPLTFYTGGSKQMTLTNSGNLGLGVTPSAWSVYKSFDIETASLSAAGVQVEMVSNAYFNGSNWIYKSSTFPTRYVQNSGAAGGHSWFTAPSGTAGNTISFTQAMTLDASGNLGLGVTPSAWRSINKVIQIGNAALWNESNLITWLGNNTYENSVGQYIYINSAGATAYTQYNGSHTWYNAPSGTAGNAISFTQAMTLDASGLLNVGGTGGTKRLNVFGDSRILNVAPTLDFTLSTNTAFSHSIVASNYSSSPISSNTLEFRVASGASTQATVMTLNGAGNVGIGTTSPDARLTVIDEVRVKTAATSGVGLSKDGSGAYLYNIDNTFMAFGTNNTERMRITSGGEVGIGTQTPALVLEVNSSTTAALPATTGSTQSGGGRLRLTTTGASTAVIDFGTAGGSGGWVQATNKSDLSTNYPFLINPNGGNVGIGTTNPGYKLDVNGSIYTNQEFGYYFQRTSGTPSDLYSWSANAGSAYLYNHTTSNVLVTFLEGGNVGIGTTNPDTKLQVAETGSNGISVRANTSGDAYYRLYLDGTITSHWYSDRTNSKITFGAVTNIPLTFETNSAERMRITSGGEVYIGNNPADQGAYNLQVNGTGVWGAGAYVDGSDSAVKKNIQPLGSSLDLIKQMKPVTFEYQPFYSKDTTTQTGFIAQELQQVLSDKVYKNGIVKEGGQYLGVAYQHLIPLLVKAIQELEAKVENLKTQLNNR